jgi:hypothetical protein
MANSPRMRFDIKDSSQKLGRKIIIFEATKII